MKTVSDGHADESRSGQARPEGYEPPAIAMLGRFEEFTLSASGITMDAGSKKHTPSDRALKRDIRPVTAALERLRRI
jgi:hypothetical protein